LSELQQKSPLGGATMSAAPNAKVNALAVFCIRCEARALLVAAGELDLHTAVDGLQADAEAAGLVDDLGQDQVQTIMSSAFAMAVVAA
jgi:hypothetical protein